MAVNLTPYSFKVAISNFLQLVVLSAYYNIVKILQLEIQKPHVFPRAGEDYLMMIHKVHILF